MELEVGDKRLLSNWPEWPSQPAAWTWLDGSRYELSIDANHATVATNDQPTFDMLAGQLEWPKPHARWRVLPSRETALLIRTVGRSLSLDSARFQFESADGQGIATLDMRRLVHQRRAALADFSGNARDLNLIWAYLNALGRRQTFYC
ncbi:MAG: hypothetical protein CMJ58_18275 [Planctomycetaceae bacterium]|nr:hypothetical protein [Planctomycetaceae bacterium]